MLVTGVLAGAMDPSAWGQTSPGAQPGARPVPSPSRNQAPRSDATDELIAGLRVPGGLTADAAAARARRVSPRAAESRADSAASDALLGLARLGWLPRLRAAAQYLALVRWHLAVGS